MQGALAIAGLLNFVDGNGIRTDGSGNPRGIPGGHCETCEGSSLAQAVYLTSTLFQLFSGAASLCPGLA